MAEIAPPDAALAIMTGSTRPASALHANADGAASLPDR
jgi:hypothetical protein